MVQKCGFHFDKKCQNDKMTCHFEKCKVYVSFVKFCKVHCKFLFINGYRILQASLVAQMVKNLPTMQETRVQSLGRSPGEGNGTHSSIFAWGIPRTEDPDWLQSMEFQSWT